MGFASVVFLRSLLCSPLFPSRTLQRGCHEFEEEMGKYTFESRLKAKAAKRRSRTKPKWVLDRNRRTYAHIVPRYKK